MMFFWLLEPDAAKLALPYLSGGGCREPASLPSCIRRFDPVHPLQIPPLRKFPVVSDLLRLDTVQPLLQRLALHPVEAVVHRAPQLAEAVVRMRVGLEQQRDVAVFLGEMADLLQHGR